MCVFMQSMPDLSEITVYKVAWEKEPGRYFSIATGIEYLPGKVQQPKGTYPQGIKGFFNSTFLKKGGLGYHPLLVGKTVGFWSYRVAKNFLCYVKYESERIKDYQLCILEMNLSQNIYRGLFWSNASMYAGEVINSLTKIQEV